VTKLQVLLVDDHPVVRNGLRTLIEAEPDLEVVGEAIDGESAVLEAARLRPDVVVMDLSMPGMGGVEATARIRRECPDVWVVVLSAHEDRAYLHRSLAAGATGFVLKRAAALELIRAIRRVADGETYLDPAATDQVVAALAQPGGGAAGVELSDREGEVLRLTAEGYLNKQIASRLSLSVKTVETYKARAMEKLALRSRVDVVRYATERGWLRDR
jgi:DNA-binding NarL/FixJ family response regulator